MKPQFLLIAGALIAGWFFLGGSGGMPSFGGSSDRGGGRRSGFEQSREPACCTFGKEPDDYSDSRSQSKRYSNRFSGRNRY
jgi:hypothetical protein